MLVSLEGGTFPDSFGLQQLRISFSTKLSKTSPRRKTLQGAFKVPATAAAPETLLLLVVPTLLFVATLIALIAAQFLCWEDNQSKPIIG